MHADGISGGLVQHTVQLGLVQRPGSQRGDAAFGGGAQLVGSQTGALHPQPPGEPRAADRVGDRPEVPGGHHVDGGAHEGRLDDSAPMQGPVEVAAAEAVETRPQADVRRRRVLRLDATHPFHRHRQAAAVPVQQSLPREHRPVQLALREDTRVAHPGTVVSRADDLG